MWPGRRVLFTFGEQYEMLATFSLMPERSLRKSRYNFGGREYSHAGEGIGVSCETSPTVGVIDFPIDRPALRI